MDIRPALNAPHWYRIRGTGTESQIAGDPLSYMEEPHPASVRAHAESPESQRAKLTQASP